MVRAQLKPTTFHPSLCASHSPSLLSSSETTSGLACPGGAAPSTLNRASLAVAAVQQRHHLWFGLPRRRDAVWQLEELRHTRRASRRRHARDAVRDGLDMAVERLTQLLPHLR
eukprot:366083-Chlamydomonas_euryale.AAC.7